MYEHRNRARGRWRSTLAIATIFTLIATLSACGGGNSGSSVDQSAAAGNATPPAAASDTPATPSPSTNASFFDGVFVKDTGTGYYQFDATPASSNVTGVGRTGYYVNSDADSNFTLTSETVAGTFVQQYDKQVYITAEGAFVSQSTLYTNIGTNSKIFAKLPQGYELGMQGMSTPLYQVTMNAQDVSGQPVAKVIHLDEGIALNGLSRVLSTDSSPMPQGAQILQVPYTVLTTHLWVNLTTAQSALPSLEIIQALDGGTIQSLGGYRYLKPAPNSATYVEYEGAIYYGVLFSAGDLQDAVPAAYNRIAADFIVQREAAASPQ
jgi:hypothetical protein